MGEINSSYNNRRIVGITGSFGSGSTTVAEIFRDRYKYRLLKVSDLLKKKAKKQGISGLEASAPFYKKRRILQDLGNGLRLKYGRGYLIQELLTIAEKENINESIVIDSIKNPGEIDELKNHPNTYVMAVNASEDIRWKRVQEDKYQNHLIEFKEDDRRDKNEDLDHGQNVQKCVDLADIYIYNEKHRESTKEKEQFKQKIDKYVKLIKEPGSRKPSTLELLMNNAYHISLSSNCIKRQVGAVISVPRDKDQLVPKKKESREYMVASGCNAVHESEEPCEIEYEKCFRDIEWNKSLKKIGYCPGCGTKLVGSNEVVEKCCNSECRIDFRHDLFPSKALDLCRAIHAEENAILQVSRLGGISLKKANLYTTTFPCQLCAKKIISVGISRVVWLEPYPYKEAERMLKKAKVSLIQFEGVKAQAFYQLFKKSF